MKSFVVVIPREEIEPFVLAIERTVGRWIRIEKTAVGLTKYSVEVLYHEDIPAATFIEMGKKFNELLTAEK